MPEIHHVTTGWRRFAPIDDQALVIIRLFLSRSVRNSRQDQGSHHVRAGCRHFAGDETSCVKAEGIEALAAAKAQLFKPFDIVTSYIIHHELPGDISKQVFREAHRITRPGGYYYPIDFRSGRQARRNTAYGMFRRWWDHRWNNERWSLSFRSLAFEDEMEKAGLILNPKAKAALRGFGIRQGVKSA